MVQIKATDVQQGVYGIPEYLSALHAAQLNRLATLFRRKYYDNGSHAGFILYMTEPAQNTDDVDNLRKALKGAKGPSSFPRSKVGDRRSSVGSLPITRLRAPVTSCICLLDAFASIT